MHTTKNLTPYVKRVFNFIGINNFISVVAEGLATEDKMETSLANARGKLEKQAKFFYKSDKAFKENLSKIKLMKGYNMNIYNKKKVHFSIKALMLAISIACIPHNSNAMSEEAQEIKTTKKLLVVNASPSLENSHSRTLSHYFVSQLENHYPEQYRLVHRDLAKDPIPYIDDRSLEVILAGTATTLEARSLEIFSDTLIDEIDRSDAIIVATPMHNFTVPAPLKAYFDLVLRAGKTFKYTSSGPEGMLIDRPIMLIYASGGCYHGTTRDFLTPYVQEVFSFIGINNFTSVFAEGLAMHDKKETSLIKAKEELEGHVKTFHEAQKASL